MKDGCVYPKGLPKVLQEYGLCAKYYSGNLKALQNEVCKGTPVIVMIRVRNDKNWLHYVPVVGFDDRYVFVAESLPELVNCNCKYYNRRIEKKFFLQLWNTAMLKQPLFRNTFYVVTKYNTKLQLFPSNIIAGMFNFTTETLFEVDSAEARKNVKVDFNN